MKHWNELLAIQYGDYPPDGMPFTALRGKRKDILDYLDAVLCNQNKYGKEQIGFTITMPCGYEQSFSKREDIPHKDLPCPCGKANRFLIQFN